MDTKEANCGLEFTGAITAPEHEYLRQQYNPVLAEAFNSFADSCMDYLETAPLYYPNAVMRVEPVPAYMEGGNISFMVAWGERTELPLPRPHKIAEYFNRRTRRLAREKQFAETMDGYGFVGRVGLQGAAPVLVTAIGVPESDNAHISRHLISTPELADLAVVETAASLQVGRPLRFHEAAAWHPKNNHIYNHSYPDDELKTLSRF